MKMFVLALVPMVASGCMFVHMSSGVKGSGKVVESDRQVGAFSRIVNSASCDVVYTQGPSTSVRVQVDDNLGSLLTTKVMDGVLRIETEKSISPTKCVVTITSPSLSAFACEGAGDATLSGLNSKDFEARVEGAGDIRLSGKAERATLAIEGAGDITAIDFHTDRSRASIEGAGSIELAVSSELDATIEGAGSIRYKGSPRVSKKIEGAGSIDEIR